MRLARVWATQKLKLFSNMILGDIAGGAKFRFFSSYIPVLELRIDIILYEKNRKLHYQ
jgi:hypothetical protein